MQTRFIHILLSVMAAGWLSASCSSDIPGEITSGSELQFAVPDVSRATETANINREGAQFAIFGDMKSADPSLLNKAVIFNGDKVSYENSKWNYANTQYWFPNFEYSFVAMYPAEVAGVSGTAYSDNTLSFDYTLPEAFGETPDLLVATHRRMYESGRTDPVMLRFVHALSRVDFKVKCDGAGEKLKVTKIELAGIHKSGTLAVEPAFLTQGSKQTDDYDLSWTAAQGDEPLVADIAVEVADGSESHLFPNDDALFVIPQPGNEKIILKITYTVFYKNGKSEEKTLAAETRIGGWQPGKVYTYSLSISAEAEVIEVNVSVNDWKEGSEAGVTVPRK